MPYTKESSDLPKTVGIVPAYDSAGNINAVRATFVWVNRIKNDSDASDIIEREVSSKTVDLFDNAKTVTIAGGIILTYRQIASALKKVADVERG